MIVEHASRYSCANITNIDEFTGKFNLAVENITFAELYEMINYNYSNQRIATVIVIIISDLTI